MTNLLKDFGMAPDPKNGAGNSAATVMITAKLPPLAKIGDKFDLGVSTVGDAASLENGVLLPVPLKGPDRKVYAVASGRITTSNLSQGRATYGRIVDGGTVERQLAQQLPDDGKITLNLHDSDFTNSSRIAKAINQHFRGFFAKPIDASSVSVIIPRSFLAEPVRFIAEIEAIDVEVDRPAKVIVNQATGTVVVGKHVTISPVSIAHQDLVLMVGDPKAKDSSVKRTVTVEQASVDRLVETLNLIGADPQDLVSILQALKKAGAIQAEVEFL
jgi:flagellar P-ring protein precursor FlgI